MRYLKDVMIFGEEKWERVYQNDKKIFIYKITNGDKVHFIGFLLKVTKDKDGTIRQVRPIPKYERRKDWFCESDNLTAIYNFFEQNGYVEDEY